MNSPELFDILKLQKEFEGQKETLARELQTWVESVHESSTVWEASRRETNASDRDEEIQAIFNKYGIDPDKSPLNNVINIIENTNFDDLHKSRMKGALDLFSYSQNASAKNIVQSVYEGLKQGRIYFGITQAYDDVFIPGGGKLQLGSEENQEFLIYLSLPNNFSARLLSENKDQMPYVYYSFQNIHQDANLVSNIQDIVIRYPQDDESFMHIDEDGRAILLSSFPEI